MADISQTNWTEIDAQNNYAAPLGWTPGAMLPSQVEPTAQMMMGALKRFWNRANPIYAAVTSLTDVYTATPNVPITSLTAFEEFNVRFSGPNLTTSPSLIFANTPQQTIKKYSMSSLTALSPGDIQGHDHRVYWDNTQMILANPALPGIIGSVNGPASSTAHNFASFTDGSGKVLEDSGIAKATVVKNAVTSTSQSIPVFTDTSGTVIGNGYIAGAGSANLLLLATSASTLPPLSGVNLTTLNASNITSGTLNASRLNIGNNFSTSGTQLIVNGNNNFGTPAIFVFRSVDQQVTSATFVKILFNSPNVDTNNAFNASTSTFFPQVAGTYFVAAAMIASATQTAGQQIECVVQKNGSGSYATGYGITEVTNSGLTPQVSINTLITLNGTTDTVNIAGYIEGSSTKISGAVGGIPYFLAYRIGP